MTFTSKSQFAVHIRTHSAGQNYECNLCGRTFIRDSYLIRHHNRVHRDRTQTSSINATINAVVAQASASSSPSDSNVFDASEQIGDLRWDYLLPQSLFQPLCLEFPKYYYRIFPPTTNNRLCHSITAVMCQVLRHQLSANKVESSKEISNSHRLLYRLKLIKVSTAKNLYKHNYKASFWTMLVRESLLECLHIDCPLWKKLFNDKWQRAVYIKKRGK